jgi:hypothetical protein
MSAGAAWLMTPPPGGMGGGGAPYGDAEPMPGGVGDCPGSDMTVFIMARLSGGAGALLRALRGGPVNSAPQPRQNL